jgi:predicted nuclease with RNAse H fold
MPREYVPDSRTVLGIDLGGARMATTGWVLLQGDARPTVTGAGRLAKASTVADAEESLARLIADASADVVAVDAPLTLPPCLTCPPYCRGPSPAGCELQSSKLTWEVGGNPLTERLCEVLLREELAAGPLPTMRIGQIAARGVALARRLERGTARVIEVYPYASLHRLGHWDAQLKPRAKGEADRDFTSRVVGGLARYIDGLCDTQAFASPHVLDALVAGYTGWLWPDGLESPPSDFNEWAGWIWAPRPTPPAPLTRNC